MVKTLPKSSRSEAGVGLIVSRCDRIGDLVLSLPAIGLLRDAGVSRRVLHCLPYCRDLAALAIENGLVEAVWIDGEAMPVALQKGDWGGVALFHGPHSPRAFRDARTVWSLGPRAKLSALWSYSSSVAQHRSRVAKSEMHYNLDLARRALAKLGLGVPAFRGLPALRLPAAWRPSIVASTNVLVVSNRGSAGNWPVERYEALATERLAAGESVDLLVSGIDAAERREAIARSGLEARGARVIGDLESLRDLISYLASAKRVVSSSTGPLHLAHALGVDVFGVYPRERVQSFERWRPDGYWHAGELRFTEL